MQLPYESVWFSTNVKRLCMRANLIGDRYYDLWFFYTADTPTNLMVILVGLSQQWERFIVFMATTHTSSTCRVVTGDGDRNKSADDGEGSSQKGTRMDMLCVVPILLRKFLQPSSLQEHRLIMLNHYS